MISFCKMQATGNDFIIIDLFKENFRYTYYNLSKFLCNRKFGVGADGVIFIDKSKVAEFKMRIFNQDGTEAEMCGNGIRALAKYAYEEGITDKKEFLIETLAGNKFVELIIENKTVIGVKVEIGNPIFEYNKIPVIFPNIIDKELESVKINYFNKEYEFFPISMGNPHAVCFVEKLEEVNLEEIGPVVENYKYFPKKTNVEFVEVINKSKVKVLVWERGVGRTLSCGTGACAVSCISNLKKSTNSELTVELEGGILKTIFNGESIKLIGNAEVVFKGNVDI